MLVCCAIEEDEENHEDIIIEVQETKWWQKNVEVSDFQAWLFSKQYGGVVLAPCFPTEWTLSSNLKHIAAFKEMHAVWHLGYRVRMPWWASSSLELTCMFVIICDSLSQGLMLPCLGSTGIKFLVL